MARRRTLLAATVAAALVAAVLFAGLAAGSLAARAATPASADTYGAATVAAPSNRAGAVLPATPVFRVADARPLRFVHRSGPLLLGLGLLAILAVVVSWLVDGTAWSPRRLALGDRGRPRAPPLLV